MSALERRYRRLLALYPADYRAEYGDEMLGVLMSAAAPDRQYPRAGEAANLLVNAGAQRLRGGGTTTVGGGPWTDAVAVIGTILPLFLLARSVRAITDRIGWSERMFVPWPTPDLVTWLRIAGWAAISVAVLIGMRRIATVMAAAIVVGEVAVAVVRMPDPRFYPEDSVAAFWTLLLAVLATGAIAMTGRRRGVVLIGRIRLMLVGLAAAVAAAAPLAVPYLVTPPAVPKDPDVVFYAVPVDANALIAAAIALYGSVAVSVVVAAFGLDPAVRRRVAALLAAVVALFLVVQFSAEVSFAWSYTAAPALTGAYQWPVLIGAPVAVLLIGLLAISLRERRQSVPDQPA
jgi:hypothetical protein